MRRTAFVAYWAIVLVLGLMALAASGPVSAAEPTLEAQTRDPKVQRWLIASGLLEAEVGRAYAVELFDAVGRLRGAPATVDSPPLSADELKTLEDNYNALSDIAGLTSLTGNVNKLKTLYPAKLLPIDPAQKDDSAWTGYDAPDKSVGIDFFLKAQGGDKGETAPSLLAGGLRVWKNVTHTYLQNTRDWFVSEGVGDLTHKGGVTRRYYFHNRAFEYEGFIRGLYLKFSIDPPQSFVAPAFLAKALADPAIKAELTALGAKDERSQAWLALSRALTSLIVSDFRTQNGGREISTAKPDGTDGCTSVTRMKRRMGSRQIRVVFATNRQPYPSFRDNKLTSLDPNLLFGTTPTGDLHFGCADLITGKIRPQVGEAATSQRPRLAQPPYYAGAIPVNEAPYARLVDQQEGREDQSALLFIHGYNNSFSWSLQSVASLVAATSYPGRVYLFSWPSAEKIGDYLSDIDRAAVSESNLAAFMKAVLQDGNVTKLDIVAHSMGAQQFLRAFDRIQAVFDQRAGADGKTRLRLGQVVLAAPDVEQEFFVDQVEHISKTVDRVTIYTSQADWALYFSRLVHGTGNRAGYFDKKNKPVWVNAPNVFTIDASPAEETWLSQIQNFSIHHADFLDMPIVAADISAVLEAKRPRDNPDSRDKFCRVGTPGAVPPTPYYWRLLIPNSKGQVPACPVQ